MMQIKPEEVSKLIKEQIKNYENKITQNDTGTILMIGDGIHSDVLGANRAGVDMCWFNPKGKALPEGMHAEYEVQDIRDCVAIALAE